MGEQRVSILSEGDQMHRFVRNLLRDVQALDYMLHHEWFETDPIRIGAEQEMCLVDADTFKPAPIAMKVLDKLKGADWAETELARFNLEINANPRIFEGSCLTDMEKEISGRLSELRKVVQSVGADIVLTGILPTLRKFDLGMHNLTPKKRYKALMEAINNQLEGNAYQLRLSGLDELHIKHDSPLLEACNTSFQVHLQTRPDDFVKMYNIAQSIAAPVMAVAANSPVVFGKRLWHETRIALFQQSLDTRSSQEHMRQRSPRVIFGNDWLDQSIMEIYKEDIARFRVLISGDIEEDALRIIADGHTPKLRALQVHNSTIYRWNRPCYGISDNGQPHLRIENRVLPSGPTVLDEMANAAYWLGLMEGIANRHEDVRSVLSFDDVRDNFAKAARFGIDSKFTWHNDKKITVRDLTLDVLLPIARAGLESKNVNPADIDRYLDVIAKRCENHVNGATWTVRSIGKLKRQSSMDEALTTVTAAIIKNQHSNLPVHEWPLPELKDLSRYRPDNLLVEEFMETDLFTVRKDDILELVSDMMDWRKIRYTPVENKEGELVGLVTSRLLLRHFTRKVRGGKIDGKVTLVKELMVKDPICVSPDMRILDALQLMKEKRIGCLPVTKSGHLIGIITEGDFLKISGRLLRRMSEEKGEEGE